MEMTDEQWEKVEPLLSKLPRRADGRGRPWKPSREVLDAILWILRTGSPWKDLPERYPPYQTCHRRFQRWVRDGSLERVVRALAEELMERRGIDLSETFIDGAFVPAKKGEQALARQSGAKARR